ncbi:MAG TPA: type III pantothenate kinase, partial [Fimbriimonas sp.]|nr:type III pantothenate kinase [Fimbriimonas sp.]
MLLAIDVGNSHTVFGLWNGKKWVATWRHRTDIEVTEDELAGWLFQMMEVEQLSGRISSVACASVVPGFDRTLSQLARRYFQCEVKFLRGDSDHGIPIDYTPVNGVGADRIANALAALDSYSAPIIVVDFGTATTFDVIDRDGHYSGGAIMAG